MDKRTRDPGEARVRYGGELGEVARSWDDARDGEGTKDPISVETGAVELAARIFVSQVSIRKLPRILVAVHESIFNSRSTRRRRKLEGRSRSRSLNFSSLSLQRLHR